MASAKEVVQWLPETLPEDFCEWDSESSSAAETGKPVGLGVPHASGDAPKPLGAAEREAILASVLDRTRDRLSASSVPRILKQPKSTTAIGDRLPSRAPQRQEPSKTVNAVGAASTWSDVAAVDETRSRSELRAAAIRESDGILFQSFSPNEAVVGEQKTTKKKWMILAAVSACSILLLLLLLIPLFRHGTKPVAKQSVQSRLGTTDTQQWNMPKPSASEPLTQENPQAKTEAQKEAEGQPTSEEKEVESSHVQANMMNDQLTAPTRIPQDIKKRAAEDAPPPGNLATAGLGGSSADESVFKGQAQPIVKAAKPIPISAGVATGLLIQKTVPLYPAIARSARVTGTVVMQAIISKEGTIKDLRVESGPTMLRQSAVDAVRSWRYKPYRLNNEPTEIETTINVIFSLGG